MYFIENEFIFRHNIEVVGISSDGDVRLLACMKKSLNSIRNQVSNDVLSNLNSEQSVSFIQDSIHLATKLRNRLLKTSILLPIGFFQVSVTHLKILIQIIKKEVHGLVLSDLCPEDRQNFASFQKITSDRVLNLLTMHVPDSEATVIYLKLSRDFVRAFTEVDLAPLDRISMAWKTLYFFRAWHNWMLDWMQTFGSQYSIDENFISTNGFDCMELNAYGLLHLIKKFRDANQPNLFLISLFNSQPCEQTFRQLRSMTTANWTRINFTLHELLHMISRIELQNDIAFFKLRELAILPRINNRADKHTIFELPKDEEMRTALKHALESALLDAAKLGIQVDSQQILHSKISRGNIFSTQQKEQKKINETDGSMTDFTYFRDYSKNFVADENNRFLQVYEEDGSVKVIRKSAVVSMVSDPTKKLSKDRLKRVQLTEQDTTKKQKIKTKSTKKPSILGELCVSKEIEIGEWCLFKLNDKEEKNIIMGQVLAFKYLNGKSQQEKKYSLDSAPVHYDGPNKRGLGVLALWYRLADNLSLELLPVPSFFHNIENYVASTDPPKYDFDKSTKKKSCKLDVNIDEFKINLQELLSQ